MAPLRHIWGWLLLAVVMTTAVQSQHRNQAPRIGMRGFNPAAGSSFLTASIMPSFSNSRSRSVRNQPRLYPNIFKKSGDHRERADNPHRRRDTQSFIPVSFNPLRGNPHRRNPLPHRPEGGGISFPSANEPPRQNAPDDNGRDEVQSPTPSEAPANSPDSPNHFRKIFRSLAKPRCAEADDNLPCESDSEYDEVLRNKVASLLSRSRLNSVINSDIVSNLINDTAIAREKDIHDPIIIRTGAAGPETRGGFVTESPACAALESIIYPQRAKTPADDWVFVVNQDMVRQGVRVEKCLRETSSCNLGAEMPPTVQTVCRQKFIYRKLLVLNQNGTDIQSESVLIPSCCVCYVRRFDEILNPRVRNTTNGANPIPAQPAVLPDAQTASPTNDPTLEPTANQPDNNSNSAPIIFNTQG